MLSFLTNPVVLTILALMMVYYLYYLIHFFIMLLQWPIKVDSKSKINDRYEVWFMIPALNEEKVIEGTINSLLDTVDGLPSNIAGHVLVIDDNSDDGTFLKAAAITTTIKTPVVESRTGKGSVLNTGSKFIEEHHDKTIEPDHVIIGVIDADGSMNIDSLNNVMRCFYEHPEAGMVQTAVRMHDATNPIQMAQEYDFGESNRKQQLLRERYGYGIASGNGQFVTLELVSKVSWGNALLEDMEYTIKSWLAGFKTMFIDQAVVYQEAVRTHRAYLKQRIRWCMGGLQCIRYAPALWRSNNVRTLQKFTLISSIISPVFSPVLALGNLFTLVIQIILLFVLGDPAFILSLVGIWLLVQLLGAIDYKHYTDDHSMDRSYLMSFVYSLCFQMYNFTLNSIIPIISIIKLIRGDDHWVKTEHNG